MLWLASDQLAADAPSALRRIGPGHDQTRARELWSRLQGVLHPQVPRCGAVIAEADQLWLVRDWQAGRTFQELLEARRERQLVFGPGEVLLLLRQLLPVLAALHSQELLHGDLSPANLLRRDSDGLPVLLDFGLVRGTAPADGSGDGAPADTGALLGATPGYAPPELVRGEPAQPWMDLHALGVVALVLLSGDEPHDLLDPVSLEWRWPAVLESEPALRQQLERLLARDPAQRFASAAQALAAFQHLEMPDSTGPVPRADRTVVLVPPAAPPAPEPPVPDAAAGTEASPDLAGPPVAEPVPTPLPLPAPRPRYLEKEEAAEGGLWPVLLALVLSAVAGTALGWWWLGRGKEPPPSREASTKLPSSLPPAEVDQRQQLLNRLRAMQVDRGWFVSLADASLLAQYPERKGRLPSDALEDAPLRRVWNELSEEWLARVEQLPLAIRRRLGSFSSADWDRRQEDLLRGGLSSEVLKELVSGSARNLLPGRSSQEMPAEPFRQLWFAAAEQTLANLQVEPIEVRSQITQVVSADVPASGARVFPIRVPPDHSLVVGVNGTPLLQMSLFAPDGRLLAPRGALRVVNLGEQKTSPVQLLVTNDGVAPARISLSLRADPPAPPPPAAEPAPPPPGPGDTPSTPENPSEEPALTTPPATPTPAQPPSGTPSTAPSPPAAPVNPDAPPAGDSAPR
ncbi:MAG TPA: serine/threonine protein kinase [Cyanobium sp.]|nr:serine/threonine protein kinase [Cyanobium sp.]